MKIIALGSNIPFKNVIPIKIIEKTYTILENYNINIIKKSHIYIIETNVLCMNINNLIS